jgi:hypothetical protein
LYFVDVRNNWTGVSEEQGVEAFAFSNFPVSRISALCGVSKLTQYDDELGFHVRVCQSVMLDLALRYARYVNFTLTIDDRYAAVLVVFLSSNTGA